MPFPVHMRVVSMDHPDVTHVIYITKSAAQGGGVHPDEPMSRPSSPGWSRLKAVCGVESPSHWTHHAPHIGSHAKRTNCPGCHAGVEPMLHEQISAAINRA